jgi:hypothetical protein
MFWHQSAILRGSTKTKKNKFNTPIQVLIALTSSSKYYNVKILEYTRLKKYTSTIFV